MNKRTLLISAESAKPYTSRELVEVASGQTIFEILEGQGLLKFNPEPSRIGYYVVVLNGRAILQAEWNTVVSDTDVVQVIHLPMGGGGSNIGMILVTVIAVAAAAFTGGASLGVAAAWGAAAGAAVGVLSSMVPTAATNPSSMDRESASTTYSISSQNNSARLLEAIPVLYGRMRMYPDLAAQPYTENNGNVTYLYQLFCVTQGTLDIEKMMIEDSDISSFGEVQYEVIPPGGKVTLFPSNVVTAAEVQGLELKGPNEDDYSVMGPYITSPSGTVTSKLAVDVTFPQGAYTIDKKGGMNSASATFKFEAQKVDDLGNPVGGWIALGEHTETFSTMTAQMLTYRYDVPEGRYQVKGYRVSDVSKDTKVSSKLQWSGLRAYLTDDNEYGNVTLVAMIIQATNNLNSNTSRRFNLIGTRKISTWDPVNGFSAPVATRNPAWAFLDVLRNADYGAAYAPSKVNLAEVYRLSKVWDQRGDTFNAVFDTTQTLWEALSQICAVGRATPVYYAGMIDLVRDEPRTLETALFHPGNIVKNSFSTVYKFPTSQTPDHVIIQYFDQETWQSDEVTCALPGSKMLVPSTVEMFGITNRDQAWREGMYKAAVNRDQRRRINWSTELEGLLPKLGDVVGLSHDVPGWGQTGFVVSLDRSSGKIVATEPFVWDSTATSHQIVFQKLNGRADGPYTIRRDTGEVAGIHSAIVVASPSELAAIRISDGIRTDYTTYQFGAAERTSLKAVILSTKPGSNGQVAIVATNYADGPHIAENGGVVPPPGPISNLPGVTVGPVVDSVQVIATPVVGQQQIVATAARGAIQYEFQARQGNDNWSQLGLGPNPFMFVNLSAGTWQVRVRAIGSLPGPWATWEGLVEMTSIAIPPISAFSATIDLLKSIRLDWAWGDGADLLAAYAQIYYSLTNKLADAIPFRDVPYPATSFTMDGLKPGDQFFFWIRPVDTAGRTGPWFKLDPTEGRPTTDARVILDDIAGEIREDDLYQSLQEKVNLITAPIGVPGSVNERIKEAQDEVQAGVDQANQAISDLNGEVADIQNQLDNIGDLADAQEYKADKAYAAGLIVTKANGLWQAKVDVPAKADGSNGPPNSTYWRDAGGIIKEGDGLASRVTSQGQTITQQGTAITANSNDITQLKSSVAGKADASAVQALTTRVTTAEGKIDSQGQSITSLQNSLAGKADASALSALTTRVTTAEGKIDSQGQSITSLQNTVANKADASALSALTTRVSTAEGKIDSQGQSITSLTNTVSGKADSSTVTALTNRVTATETAITSQGQSITSINAAIGDAGGENLLYNPTFTEISSNPALAQGWNLDGGVVDSTTSATGSLVQSWLSQNEKSMRIDFKGINTSNRYFSINTAVAYRAKVAAGQTVTVSMYVRGTPGIRVQIYLQALNAAGTALDAPASVSQPMTAAGSRMTFTYANLPADTAQMSIFYRVRAAADGTADGYIEGTRAQLEIGARATGWSDNGKVNAAAIAAQATATSALTARVTQAEGNITSQSSSIISLQNNLGNAGGQNLLYNPSFDLANNTNNADGLAFGTGNGATITGNSLVASTLDPAGKMQSITSTGLSASAYTQAGLGGAAYRPSVSAGQIVAVSAYVQATAGLLVRLFAQACDVNGTVLATYTGAQFTATGTASWTRISVITDALPANTVSLHLLFRTNGTASITAGVTNWDRAQVEIGSAVTGWTDNTQVLSQQQAATASALATLTTTVTQQGTAITSQGASITSLNNSVSLAGGLNYLFNPSFDQNSGTSGVADGWQKQGSATSSGTVVASTFKGTGTAQRIDSSDLSTSKYAELALATAKRIKGLPGEVYVLSTYFKMTAGARFEIYIIPYSSTGTQLVGAGYGATASGNWERQYIACTLPANTATFTVFLRLVGTASITTAFAEWDDIQVEKGSTPSGWRDSTGVIADAQAATASALSSLTTRVTSAEGSITSQGQAITRLQSDIAGAGAFIAAQTFEFLGNLKGAYMEQAASGATLTANAAYATLSGYANFRLPTFPDTNGAINPIVRMRVRRKNSTRNPLRIYWANEDGGLAETRTATAPLDLTTTDWQNIEIDLSANAAWSGKAKNFTIRFDFLNSADTSAVVDIAWIAVGRKGPAASATAVNSLETTVTQQGSTITAQGTSITQLTSRVGSAESAIQSEAKTRADADSANAQATQTVQSNLNGTNATVQQISTTVTDINGKVSGSYQVKVGVTQDGKYYTAGIGIGVDVASNGITQSKVYVATDRFAVIGNGASGEDLFVVEGGRAYMNTVFINRAYITQAIIGQSIESAQRTSYGAARLNIDFNTGQITIQNAATQGRYLIQREDGIFLVADNVVVVEMSMN